MHCPENSPGMKVMQMSRQPGWQTVPHVSSAPQSQSLWPTVARTQNGVASAQALAPALTQSATPQADLVQAMANLQLSPQDPRYVAHHQDYYQAYYQEALRGQPAATQQQNLQLSPYTLSSSGTPINMIRGIVRTEARAIFVSNLNNKARTSDVEDYFSRAGQIKKCELLKDPSTGKPKGVATIEYASAEKARQAIELFDGKSFMSRRLSVRRAKEETPINPPMAQSSRSDDPLIVNGSGVRT